MNPDLQRNSDDPAPEYNGLTALSLHLDDEGSYLLYLPEIEGFDASAVAVSTHA